MSENIVLKMSNISKTFPGVKALSNVDFTLREGETVSYTHLTLPTIA